MANPHQDRRRPNKGRIMSVRVSEAEHGRLTKAAARLGITASAYVRASVLDTVDDGRTPTVIAPAIITTQPQAVSADLGELRTAVNKVGVNVNQLARLSNQRGAVVVPSGESVPHVVSTLLETREVLRQVREALGGAVAP